LDKYWRVGETWKVVAWNDNRWLLIADGVEPRWIADCFSPEDKRNYRLEVIDVPTR